jgi:hypothetical protein
MSLLVKDISPRRHPAIVAGIAIGAVVVNQSVSRLVNVKEVRITDDVFRLVA